MGAGNEVTVRVGQEQRYVQHVDVSERNAELGAGLRLDLGPAADVAGNRSVDQAARRDGLARDQLVRAQEHLVGGVRGVGLVLIYPRGILIKPLVNRAGRYRRPRQGDETGSGEGALEWGGARIERVIRLQCHEDRAVAALLQEGQAVIEE